MRNLSLIAAMLAGLLLGVPPSAARAQDLTAMVRELNDAQYRIVLGETGANAESSKRLKQVEAHLPSLSRDDWKDARNRRAAAVYLLCGGSTFAIKKLMAEGAIADEGAQILAASLAYAEGRKDEAMKLMASIDAKAFPSSLAGHLALVQGGLQSGADAQLAIGLFDYARLVMPGSLVEEAALRRELPLLDAARNMDRHLLLARRYAQRYGHSPFSKKFWSHLSATALREAMSADATRLTQYEELFAAAEPSARFEFQAALARTALQNGRLEMALSRIDRAAPLAEDARAKMRMKFYAAAAKTQGGDDVEGLAELEKIDRSQLTRDEIELLKIVVSVAGRLNAAVPEAHVAASDSKAQNSQTGIEEESPLLAETRRMLADTETLLKRAGK